MNIVTVNLPQAYIKIIEGLVGDDGLYPSRSELIRVAIRDFLKKELEIAKAFPKYSKNNSDIAKIVNLSEFEKDHVIIPLHEGSKIYKIIKK